jgi:hypothetical protein
MMYPPILALIIIGFAYFLCLMFGWRDAAMLLAGLEIGVAVCTTIWYRPTE